MHFCQVSFFEMIPLKGQSTSCVFTVKNISRSTFLAFSIDLTRPSMLKLLHSFFAAVRTFSNETSVWVSKTWWMASDAFSWYKDLCITTKPLSSATRAQLETAWWRDKKCHAGIKFWEHEANMKNFTVNNTSRITTLAVHAPTSSICCALAVLKGTTNGKWHRWRTWPPFLDQISATEEILKLVRHFGAAWRKNGESYQFAAMGASAAPIAALIAPLLMSTHFGWYKHIDTVTTVTTPPNKN